MTQSKGSVCDTDGDRRYCTGEEEMVQKEERAGLFLLYAVSLDCLC